MGFRFENYSLNELHRIAVAGGSRAELAPIPCKPNLTRTPARGHPWTKASNQVQNPPKNTLISCQYI